MKLLFALFLASTFFGSAFAQDRSHEFSVGGAVGVLPAAPWSSQQFSNSVSFFGLREGIWARFHMPFPEGSFELAADRLDFAKSGLAATLATANIFWRFMPANKLHPVFAFGAGIAFTENYYLSGNKQLGAFRVRGGVEYELQPRLDVAAYLDHFTILRDKEAEPTVNALSPSVAVIYYFSDPQPATAPAAK